MMASQSTRTLLSTQTIDERERASSAQRKNKAKYDSLLTSHHHHREYDIRPTDKILIIPPTDGGSRFGVYQQQQQQKPKWMRKQSLHTNRDGEIINKTSRYPLSRTPDLYDDGGQENNPFHVVASSPRRDGVGAIAEDRLKLPDISASTVRTSISPRGSPRDYTNWFGGSQPTVFESNSARQSKSYSRKSSMDHRKIDRLVKGMRSSQSAHQSTTALKYRRLGKNSHAFGRPPTDKRSRNTPIKEDDRVERVQHTRVNSGGAKSHRKNQNLLM